MSFPSATTGVGVAAKILVVGNESPASSVPGKNQVTLSISGSHGFPESFQLDPTIVDAAGTPIVPGTSYVVASVANAAAQFTETLSAAATASNGTTAYTTSSSPAAGSLVGQSFVVAGFVAHTANNGTFLCTANTTSTITLENPNGVAETQAATATSTPKVATYTGTFTGATTGSLVGKTVVIAGFVTNSVNNGDFIIVANTSTSSITVDNSAAISESASATAKVQETTNSLTYYADGAASLLSGTGGELPASSSATKVVTVSASGLLTAVTPGGSTVEVSYPTFNNSAGTLNVGGTALPINKVYADVAVNVVP